jgi:hypothetical protein
MKHGLIAVAAVVVVAAVAVTVPGCKSDGQKRLENNPDIASFVANLPTDPDAIFGVGGSTIKDPVRAIQAADASARTDLSTKLNIEIQAMIIDYYRNAGTENNQASLNFYESIRRQITNSELKGVEVVEHEQTADGRYWSLVKISKADAARQAADAIDDVYETEAARYAEFKAMDALKMMEEQLDKK